MSGYYAAADLGGTNFRVGIRAAGEAAIRDRVSVPARLSWDAEELADRAASMLGALLRRRGARDADLLGAGFALTGDVNPFTGVCPVMPRFRRLEGVPLAEILSRRLGVPVRLMNDGLCAALGELRAGAGRGIDDFLAITIGTGIGCGVVLQGRLLTGTYGRVGRAGHQVITLEAGESHCHCGQPGCWQSLAGRAGTEARARLLAAREPESALARHAAVGRVDLERVALLAAEGDAAAGSVMDETGRYVGIGLANLVKLFAPERVLVGGGIAQGNTLLLAAARRTLREYAVKPWQVVPIEPAALGLDAGLVGAGLLGEPDCTW